MPLRTLLIACLYVVVPAGAPAVAADWQRTEEAFRDAVLSMVSFFEHLDREVQVLVREESKQQAVRRLIRLDRSLYKFTIDKQYFIRTLTASKFDADAAAVSIEELQQSLRTLQTALRQVGPAGGQLDPQRSHFEDQLSRAIGRKGESLEIISEGLRSSSARERTKLRELGQQSLENLRAARQKLSDVIARIQALEVEQGSAEPGHQADG